jgi:hypothetical protein
VRFKVLFAGAFEGKDEKKLRAREGDAPGNYTSYDQSGHKRAMVAVPYKDTIVAEFTISSKDIFSAAGVSQFENMTLTSEWHVGGQSGPIEFVIAAKASREVSFGQFCYCYFSAPPPAVEGMQIYSNLCAL